MIHHGDCLAKLKGMADNSIDAIVTDPPYGIRFMAKRWDYDVPSIDVWRECLRVLKPGGHMLVACGTRTQHRMVAPIEDAGFEIRDVITWLYGSGFPKSLDVSKAIDKEAGATTTTAYVPQSENAVFGHGKGKAAGVDQTPGAKLSGAPATDAAREWEGWGTALKPACEFWTLARKPLSEPTVAKNVLKWGTGAINVDGCRVETDWQTDPNARPNYKNHQHSKGVYGGNSLLESKTEYNENRYEKGRFPANLILDEEAAQALDGQSGVLKSGVLKSDAYAKGKAAGVDRTPGAKLSGAPATDAAREWEGWGTALKPACEFWTLCRKPLSESTVAKNVLKWGTGGLNIDGTRVPAGEDHAKNCNRSSVKSHWGNSEGGNAVEASPLGRFPANLILDEEAAQALDGQSGVLKSGVLKSDAYAKGERANDSMFAGDGTFTHKGYAADSGGASRFFYCAKASKSDRGSGNNHPTVKPTSLMAYLCRLVTPPGGLVLDPFAGSGSTGVGALREGFRFVGIEREAEYVEIATRRLLQAVNAPQPTIEGESE